MKRAYESVIVFDGTLADETLDKERGAIEEFFKSTADFNKTEIWGKRKMAYPIRKKQSGYYCLFLYEGEGDVVKSLESKIKLNENVLRHLSVRQNIKAKTIALEVDPDAPKITDEEVAAAEKENADSE